MEKMLLSVLILCAPIFLVTASLVSLFNKEKPPKTVIRLNKIGLGFGILSALLSGIFLFHSGPIQIEYFNIEGLGLTLRIDNLSVLMYGMISVLALVISKFSYNYLQGDPKHGVFIGNLSIAFAAVELLVLSGNLFVILSTWIITSVALHKLLVFYSNRPKAAVAAKKKFITARISDAFLLLSFALLYKFFGTGDLEYIFKHIGEFANSNSGLFELSIVSAVVAAFFKSAQFPSHGWLVEVMETPTPVSALLHAGLLNAGPFLMIRLAHLLDASFYAPILIILVAGFTAFFGAVCFTTQPAQKTALAYSSIAHMGFSMLTSGLGLYAASMLHLVAHSFYKGHAFLSSGSAVEIIRAKKVKAPKRDGNIGKIYLGIGLSAVLYSLYAYVWNITPANNLPMFAIGLVLMLGVAQLFVTAIDGKNYMKSILKSLGLGVVITTAFFVFESGMHSYLESQLPASGFLNSIETVLLVVLMSIFTLTVFGQILAPALPQSHFWKAMGIHFRNGFYVNAFFDKWVGALKTVQVFEEKENSEVVLLPKNMVESKA